MADRPLYTIEAAIAGGSVIALSIADPDADPDPIVGKVRLFDATITVDVNTDRAALVAAETTLVDYPVGGYDLTAFDAPKIAPLGGVVITSNIIDVAYASGASVQIGGYWVESGESPDQVVRTIVIYDPVRTLASVGQGWPIVVQMGYGRNA